jgi:hypothetical protein
LNTQSYAYVTKFSSGTILAILALSGLLFLIPFAAVTPVFASNGSLPTATVTGNNPALGGAAGQMFTITLSNPTTNSYTITGFSILAPAGWTITGATQGGFLNTHPVPFTSSAVTWSVSQFTIGTAAGIPPGSSDTLAFTATAATASSTYPFNSKFTSKVQDASAVNFYNGPSFSILVIDPTSVVSAVTPAANANYVAGSAALTETATITCTVSSACPSGFEAGVPVVFTSSYIAGTTFSFTPSTATTSSTGVATTTFQPSEHATDASTVTATIGTSTVPSLTSGGTITTVAGAPTAIAWTFASANANGNHYITTQATTVNNAPAAAFTGATMGLAGASFSIADRFGNPVNFNTAGLTYSVTLTALSGGGVFDSNGLPSVITCATGGDWQAGGVDLTAPAITACPAAGTSANLPFNYFQSGSYGAIGELSASVTGTLTGTAYAGAGQSSLLVTSTFAAVSPVPTVQPITGVTLPNVPAGKLVNVTATLAIAQSGVPVTLYLDQVHSWETASGAMDYGASSVLAAGFSGGVFSTTVTTNSLGQASALFTIDTVAGSSAFFESNATAPTDASLTNALGISADSAGAACTSGGPATVCTIAGTPSTFTVLTYFNTHPLANPTSHGATGGPIYVDVAITDAYGNPATNTGVNQIQITLVASCSSACPLSATNVYIPSGFADTYNSFGAIIWTMPGATGTVTLTASGVLSGIQKTSHPASMTVVSPLPTLAIISPTPTSGDIYSRTGNVVFSGEANVSLGYASSVTISSLTYSIDGGAAQSAPITMLNQITFSVAAVMSTGVHTIAFNATDSEGNVAVGQTYTVVVDTATPQVVFSTANNANITSGVSVTAKIAVLQGDLNASSVVATVNGTALAASQVTITGTNNLGTNTTYTVTITGLTTGHDVIGLSAASLAGLTGTASSITVHVTVAFAQSFVISGTPQSATVGTFAGINASYVNLNPNSQSVVVFAVFKNSAGQTMGIGTGSLTVGAGATQSVFLADPVGLASGAYSVNIFVYTTGNLPVSVTSTVSVTV